MPSALKALIAPVAQKLEPDAFDLETAAEVAAAVDAWLETGEAGDLENVAAELFPGVSHLVVARVNSPATVGHPTAPPESPQSRPQPAVHASSSM